MDRARIWPDFRDAWILFEDADVIAIDKPVGVSSQAADPEQPDDVVTRLKRFLSARSGGSDAYLGVHQRLDRETSGVLVFARRSEANAGARGAVRGADGAEDLRRVRHRLAARRERATLRDALAPDRDGADARRVGARGPAGARPCRP